MDRTQQPLSKPALSLNNVSILCVEDEHEPRNVLANYLRRRGATVFEAENGQEGLRLFKSHRPDIVVSDIRMPVMDGIAMCQTIRKLDADAAMLFLTAHSDTGLLQRAIDLETIQYIIKPVNADSLNFAFRTALDKLHKKHSFNETLNQLHTTIELQQEETERLQGYVSQMIGNDRNIAVHAITRPRDKISGDFYTIEHTETELYVLLADGMGHGLSAILPALNIPRQFRELAGRGFSLSRIADELNQALYDQHLSGHFLVATLIKLDPRRCLIEVINCGNPPVLLTDSNGRIVHTFPSNHLAWGIVGGDDFLPEVQGFHCDTAAKLYIFSDGLTELLEHQTQKQGLEALIERIAESGHGSFLNQIDRYLKSFPKTLYHDDITLLEIAYDSKLVDQQDNRVNDSILHLPRQKDDQTDDLSPLKWISVLYVEDDSDSLACLSKFLQRRVGVLYTAENAETGLRLYKKYRPNLVICDIVLPEMNGLQLVEHIRACDPNAPIILISGIEPGPGRVAQVEAMLDLEINKFLAKPVTGDKLVSTILQCIKHLEYINSLKLSASVFMASPLAISITDHNRNIIAINPAFTAITGYTFAEVEGCNPRILSSGKHDSEFYRQMWESLNTTDRWSGEIWNRRKNGELFLEWITVNAIRDEEGTLTHYASVFSDITQRAVAEDKIRYLAHHDPLTGLPNRVLMLDRLNNAILQAQRDRSQLAVICLDIDNFKTVNDTLGHGFGDELVKDFAQSVLSSIRESDTLSRLGGDEFAILLPRISSREAAARLADKIFHAVKKTYRLAERELHISFSMGISLFPDDGDNTEALLKHADSAMYLAKNKGRNNYQFFNQALESQTERYMLIQHGLHRALKLKEFYIHYQPKFALDSGLIVGAEALLRWRSPTLEDITPAEFIPIAEETGYIVEIGCWVIEQVCQTLAAWKATGINLVPIAVNISPIQFHRGNIKKALLQSTINHRLDPSLLQIELTEGVVMSGQQKTVQQLQELKDLRFSISIDDFGTGYSSLSYLRELPIDELKIDRSFIMEISDESSFNNPHLTAIPCAVIDLAKNLGLNLVAEGVETEIQSRFLKQKGCNVIQGYLFSPPVDKDRLWELLKEYS